MTPAAGSFSFRAKQELIRIKLRHEGCLLAEIAAAAQAAGSIVISSGKINISFSFENPAVARRVYTHLKTLTNQPCELLLKKHNRLNKTRTCILNMDGEAALPVLQRAGVVDENFTSLKSVPNIIKRVCCRRAYFRMLFLTAGSVSNPEKGYHMEFTVDSGAFAESIKNHLDEMGIKAGVAKRKNSYMVYCKDGEAISSFLAFVGAHSAILAYQSLRVLKSVRNNVNRAVNCETANLQKTVDAAHRQISCIRYLADNGMLKKLSVQLRQAAEVRLANPEATIKELAGMVSPPVAKSGMSHRLKKLCELARQHGFVYTK